MAKKVGGGGGSEEGAALVLAVVAAVEELPRAIVPRVVKDKLAELSSGGGGRGGEEEVNVHKDALLAFVESAHIFIHSLSATLDCSSLLARMAAMFVAEARWAESPVGRRLGGPSHSGGGRVGRVIGGVGQVGRVLGGRARPGGSLPQIPSSLRALGLVWLSRPSSTFTITCGF